MKKIEIILTELKIMFPEASCELNYRDLYELAVAVILSAQTTDIAVNKVTGALFERYPSLLQLAEADVKEVEGYIQRLGLYRNKAKNIVLFAQQVRDNYDGVIPDNLDDLTTLAGVGRKTANVILSEYYHIPAIAVDTHVERVSKRLALAPEDATVLAVEKSLQKKIPKTEWSLAHHLFIFFGRYHCKARNPQCSDCPFTKYCRYYKKTLTKL